MYEVDGYKTLFLFWKKNFTFTNEKMKLFMFIDKTNNSPSSY